MFFIVSVIKCEEIVIFIETSMWIVQSSDTQLSLFPDLLHLVGMDKFVLLSGLYTLDPVGMKYITRFWFTVEAGEFF